MFKQPTVFVLGAGASWHYGYPTGETLVDEVAELADKLSAHCDERFTQRSCFAGTIPDCVLQRAQPTRDVSERDAIINGWQRVRAECLKLAERLRTVRPIVIDYFLFQNSDLRSIGTMLIAAAILKREALWARYRGNINRVTRGKQPNEVIIGAFEDDWLRFVVHRLLNGCKSSTDFVSNKVNFVTFNYDASLEFHLVSALRQTQMLDDIDVENFVRDRITHVYGCVHPDIPSKYGNGDDVHVVATLQRVDDDPYKLQHKVLFLNRCSSAATSIRTIGLHNKDDNEDGLKRAREWVDGASVVYILGYGFDRQNSERIALNKLSVSGAGSSKTVMFTNFKDPNTVNKRVSNLLFGNPHMFLKGKDAIQTEHRRYFEKSDGDVYQALAQDFDAVEEY